MSNKELLQQNNSKYASLIELLRNKAINEGGSILLQEKTITPSTNLQSVTPDSGYDGLSKVTVNAMPTATQATPSISVSSGGLITASSTQSAGYVTSGTKSATKQLTTQAAKTITPSTSSQTAVASGRYTTGTVTVAAIPSSYVQPSGTKTITANGTYDIKSYASATVNVASSGSNNEEINNILATLVDVGTTISFTLNGVSYNANEGMTWTDWLSSDYNVDGITRLGTNPLTVRTSNGVGVIQLSSGLPQSSTTVIIANGIYNVVMGGDT